MNRYNDLDKAVMWSREHWHVAIFVCACLAVFGAVLADLRVLSVPAALGAVLGGIIYVLWTTWSATSHKSGRKGQDHA